MKPPAFQAVFLSYASQDAEAAGRIAESLRAAGLEVWFDQSELRGGDAWDRKLRHQIRECTLFIAVVSKNTESRLEGYFRREWRMAIERTHDMAEEKAFLLPVVVDDTPDHTKHVPEKFHDVQWTRLPAGETSAAFVRRVQGLLGEAPPTAPAVAQERVAPLTSASTAPCLPPSPPPSATGSASTPPISPAGLGVTPTARRFKWGQVAFAATFALLAGFVGYLKRDSISTWLRGPKPDLETIAVMQDTQSGDAADVETLGQSIVHHLTDSLCQLPKVSVVSPEIVARRGAPPLDFARIRLELGADKLLSIRVTPQNPGSEVAGAPPNPGYEVRVSLIETRTLRHLWGATYPRLSRDVADVVENVSRDIVDALQLRLNATDRTRIEAYRLIRKGRYYLDMRSAHGLRKAVECYEQAIQNDPGFAPAHAGLANCCSLLVYYGGVLPAEGFPKAKRAAQRAIELDETLADAHTALGLVLRDYDRDWTGAEREFKRAIELNPKYATAHHWYAEYLAALGRHDESIRVMLRARDLAPLEPAIAAVLGWVYYLARQPDDAISQLTQTIERYPDFEIAHWFLSLAYAQKGQLEQAIAAANIGAKLFAGSSRITAVLATLHARAGNSTLAEELLARLRASTARENYVSPYELALMEVGFGRNDRAFELLNQAVADRRWEVVNLKMDPMLDPLRNDPRFAALVRRLGFPN